jgi:hypothetical protein
VAPKPPVSVSLNIYIHLTGLDSLSLDELLALTRRLRELHDQAVESLVDRPKANSKPTEVAPAKERKCGHCGKVLTRKVYTNGKLEAPSAFAGRDYCDRRCSRRAIVAKGLHRAPKQNPVIEDGRACPVCGKPLIRRRRENGSLEPLKDFQRRQTCDVKCGGALQRGVPKPGAGPKRKATKAKVKAAPAPDSSHPPSVKSAAEAREERKEPPPAVTEEVRWSPTDGNQVPTPELAPNPEPPVEPDGEQAEAPCPEVERTPPRG